MRSPNDTVGERRAKKKKKQAEKIVEEEAQLETEEEDLEYNNSMCILLQVVSNPFQQHLPTLIQRRPLLGIRCFF